MRNKVCFIDDFAYAVGGLNSKVEKFSYKEKKWATIPEYPLSDNLDSWASALCYTPQEYSNLQLLRNNSNNNKASLSSGIQEESKEFERLLEKERAIDAEIKQEIDKYRMKQKNRSNAPAAGSAAAQQHALGVYGDDVIEIVDGNAQPYASSDGEGNDDGDDVGSADGRKDKNDQ